MSGDGSNMRDLPHALADGEALAERLAGRRPAVFLDDDGTLTPIVDRPEDAVISESMREAVRGLARRCTVCVISGRDRPVVQEVMGLDDLVVAGSHGLDIWSPEEGTLEHERGGGFEDLLQEVINRIRAVAVAIEGALIEPEKASVAVHYRLVSESQRPPRRCWLSIPMSSRWTPGKMVYEIQPKLDWDQGKAVLHLIEAPDLDREDIVALYLSGDITDEHAFEDLSGGASGSSSAMPTIRRWPGARPRQTSFSIRRRRSSGSRTRSHAERHGLLGGFR